MFTTLNEARLRLAVLDFYEALNRLRTRLLLIARENIETYIPAYTNGVQAMPITLPSTFGAFWNPSKGTLTES